MLHLNIRQLHDENIYRFHFYPKKPAFLPDFSRFMGLRLQVGLKLALPQLVGNRVGNEKLNIKLSDA